MKKIKVLFTTLSVSAALVGLAACKDSKNKSNYSLTNAMAIEATSAVNIIEDLTAPKLMSSTINTSDVDMAMIEDVVAKGSVLADKAISIEIVDNDKEEFLEKKTISYNGISYDMYVSEIKEEIEEEDDEDEDEIEIEKKYKGIIVNDGNSYDFIAKEEYEEESEDGKKEVESELKMTVYLSYNSYVTIKQEYELDEDGDMEQKFTCKYSVDGDEKELYKIKKEIDGDEYKIKVQTPSDEFKLKYYTEDSVNYLKVEMKDYKVILTVEKSVDDAGNDVVYYSPIKVE